MKFIHTGDGMPLTEAEIGHLETAGHKLALGMPVGTTRRSFETIGGVSAYLVAGTPGNVHIHAVNDRPKTDLQYVLSILPNSFGPSNTPPDFVSGFIHSNGVYSGVEDPETGCIIPTLVAEPSITTPYVSSAYAARKLCVPTTNIYQQSGFAPNDTDRATYSQASRKRPGLFTGAMASLVQLLLGAGRFISPSVYEQAADQKKVKNPIVGAQIAVDYRTNKVDEPPNPSHFQYMKPFKEGECRGTYQTADPFSMEVPWDYRWHRTHGIVFGADKTVDGDPSIGFVVDISNLGVYAYPIQVDPVTKYLKVQKYMTRVYPWLGEPVFNGKDVFAAFGGIPLPSYFKVSELNAAVAKGKAIRLCDAAQFYGGGEFISTMFGWAFSETTGEAANITVRMDGSDGMKATHLYKLKVTGLHITKGVDDEGKKIVRVGGSGNMFRVRGGNIYHAGRPPITDPCELVGTPMFHIYEPVLGEMISYDFRYGRTGTGKEICNDSPIFCSYIKDDLHILNFTGSTPPKTDINEDTQEPCQVVGTWTTTVVTQPTKAGYFYNSTMDLRKEISSGKQVHKTKQWAAYDYTLHSQVDFFSKMCVSTRHYYNHSRGDYETHGGEGWAVNVCTSSTDRSIYFTGELYTRDTATKGYSTGLVYAGMGPEIRYTAFYYFISHWAGGAPPGVPASCMEPTVDIVEKAESCYTGGTESLVGKVKHYSLGAGGVEWCGYMANSPTGGHYSGKGVFGNWMMIGYEPIFPSDRYPEPFTSATQTMGQHDARFIVRIFGAPLANGLKIAEYFEVAALNDKPPGFNIAPSWFHFSLRDCQVAQMPVCRNFYGRDFMSIYTDLTWSSVRNFGSGPSGLGPNAIPVGGFI
jgi:hypothetical protein